VSTWLLIITLAVGCSKKAFDEDDGNDDETSQRGDSGQSGISLHGQGDSGDDADADADADGDADTDADTGGSDSDIPCEIDPEISIVDECVTAVLRCNRTKFSSTKSATSTLSGVDYRAWGCVVPEVSYGGAERVFSFAHPGGGDTVNVKLDSPCENLDLIAIPWSEWVDSEVCPSSSRVPSTCTEAHDAGGDVLALTASVATEYLIVVDGQPALEANFNIEAICPGGGGSGSGGSGSGGSGSGSGGGGP